MPGRRMGWHFLGYNNKSSFGGIVKMFPGSGNWHVDLKIAHKKLKYVAVKLIILTLHSNLSWSISIMQYCDTQLIVIFIMYFSPFLCITYFKKNIWKQTACTCFFMKTAYFLLTQYGIIIFWLTDVRFFYSYLNMNQILPWNPGRLCIMQLLFRT